MDASEATAAVKLPRWQSHKQVFADKICGITQRAENAEPEVGGDSGLRWTLNCGAVIIVTKDIVARSRPDLGDYFVQYEDGYQSWSPQKAFEDGYTRLDTAI